MNGRLPTLTDASGGGGVQRGAGLAGAARARVRRRLRRRRRVRRSRAAQRDRARSRLVAQAAARFGAGARVEHVHVDAGLEPRSARRATRATPRSNTCAPRSAPTRSSRVTRATTRPRPCCSTCCAGARQRAWRASPRGAGTSAVRCSTAAGRDRASSARRSASCAVHDPMNDDLRHRRVWLRREIIPALERGADRDLVDVLARQADVLRDDDELLDVARDRARAPTTRRRSPRCPSRSLAGSCALWLGSPPPALATVERVLAVARGDAVATELPGGDRVERVGGRLVRIRSGARPRRRSRAGRARAAGPGALRRPSSSRRGSSTARRSPGPTGAGSPCATPISSPPRPSSPRGGRSPARRPVSPVVEADGPLWRVGYGIERRVRVSSRTRRYLWLSAEAASPDVLCPTLM